MALASEFSIREIELGGGRAPIDRRDDDAGELAGPVQGRGLPAILQHREQMIAGLEPELGEAAATAEMRRYQSA